MCDAGFGTVVDPNSEDLVWTKPARPLVCAELEVRDKRIAELESKLAKVLDALAGVSSEAALAPEKDFTDVGAAPTISANQGRLHLEPQPGRRALIAGSSIATAADIDTILRSVAAAANATGN